jgi:hypothetical protein
MTTMMMMMMMTMMMMMMTMLKMLMFMMLMIHSPRAEVKGPVGRALDAVRLAHVLAAAAVVAHPPGDPNPRERGVSPPEQHRHRGRGLGLTTEGLH